MADEQDDDKGLLGDVASMVALRDQHLEASVEWIREMVNDPHRIGRLQKFCELLSAHPASDLRALDDRWLENVRNLAWLGLTDALNSYTQKREEDEWA